MGIPISFENLLIRSSMARYRFPDNDTGTPPMTPRPDRHLRIYLSRIASSFPNPILRKKWLASLYPRPSTFSARVFLNCIGFRPSMASFRRIRPLLVKARLALTIYSAFLFQNLTRLKNGFILFGPPLYKRRFAVRFAMALSASSALA